MTPTILALALVLAAEAPEGPAPTILVGKVREVAAGPGGRGRALLETEDGKSVTIVGQTRADDGELLRLAGAKIRVTAQAVDPASKESDQRVLRYEILEVGGGVPRLGMLAELSLDGQKRLIFVDETGTAELLPASWGKKMTQHVGAKMWLVGSKSGKELHVSKFGILRPPAKETPERGVQQ